ncbi:MAG: hypothetical protein IJ300_14310, partial [Clostridia bacterium]|nr:hypothetical protein [Clostridia bacterium]
MKRRIVAIITLSFILQIAAQYGIDFKINSVFAAVTEMCPEGILIEKENYIRTDLSTSVPEEMEGHLVTDKGNVCYTIDGKNRVTRNKGVGSTQINSYAELDFKLVTSTGYTSGAFSFAPCVHASQNQMGIRFAYVSAIKYNPETKLGDGTEVIYDRIAIVRATSDSANSWLYAAISDHELGVQSKDRNTPWLKMKGVCLDGMYYLSIYTA